MRNIFNHCFGIVSLNEIKYKVYIFNKRIIINQYKTINLGVN